MRSLMIGMFLLAAAGCAASDAGKADSSVVARTDVAFDGADYQGDSAKIAHGNRIATLFLCSGCHGPNYSGNDSVGAHQNNASTPSNA